MDICIVTDDKIEARFLLLELREAGFDAVVSTDLSVPALLYLCDLDYLDMEPPKNAIGFSYDTNKARRVDLFLPRPIDALLLRETALKLLENSHETHRMHTLTVSPQTRRVFGSQGDVRLSVKELALLLALCETSTLDRSRASEFFKNTDSNILDVYMHYLRKKLRSISCTDVITSKRGAGYSLRADITVKIL